MIKTPMTEIANRLAAFQAMLAGPAGIDAAIVRQNVDLYYFTGAVQDAHLIVPASGEPVFLVRRDIDRATEQSPIRPVVPLKSIKMLPALAADACGGRAPRRLGMELDVLPANAYFHYKSLFPESEIVDISPSIRMLRTVKSPWEIEMMRGAGAFSRVVADAVPGLLREGITELELCAELELVARKAGHLGLARTRSFNLDLYAGHVLSGPEAATPSYGDTPTGGVGLSPAFGQGPSMRRIRPGDMVSVDTMMNHNGYLNDQTRNYALGAPPEKLREAYRFIGEIHASFRREAKPGAVTGELYRAVIKHVEKSGWADGFMGSGEGRVSFVGHGVGLEVDEFPFIAGGQKMELREGMTFAFEPKIILRGIGIAGLENTYLVTKDGLESLNTATEELLVVEA